MRRLTVVLSAAIALATGSSAQDSTRFADDAAQNQFIRTGRGPCARRAARPRWSIPATPRVPRSPRVLERVVFDEILVNPELSKGDFRIDRR
jgi:hypothetical protein